MKLYDLRKELKQEFKNFDIDTEDVDYIISEVLKTKKTELNLIDEISNDNVSKIKEICLLREKNIPVQKIFKKAYFYGLEFKIDENVLCPRPETEILVETAIKYINENHYSNVLDLCTGSGCVAIAIKKNADATMLATDISPKAINIAKENAKQLDADIKFIKSDMFEGIDGKFDLIVSNPPYIDSAEIESLDLEVKNHDPKIALDGGDFGLKFYNIIHNNLKKYLSDGGMAIFEIGEDQKEMLLSLFNDFEIVDCLKDYAGLDRVLIVKK